MSDQVELSAYTEAIGNLIRSRQYDQAIGLCQHILCHYPKNIATYRQMGQAALEKGDLHSAAELFRRVLSADPEEYIAYAGLGIIFEGQGLIDEAIWHLERAFELRPNIAEIRGELLRLYGERDGRTLTRLRLTPGALARLYVREGLFAQAIQEFRAILSEAPRRLDVRLALAEACWHAGQMRDSTQVCQEILQTLPNCLKANLILGKALQESGADAGEPYLRCAQTLDPTNQVAQELFGEQSPLPPAQVFVPQYVERAAAAPTGEAAAQATEQAPAQEGFEEWFAEAPSESRGFAESLGLGTPSGSPTPEAGPPRPAAPFEHWLPVAEPSAEELPAWVSQISVPTEPAESPAAETRPVDQAPPTIEEPSPETQPPPSSVQPELPPWLLSDFGLGAPSPGAPQPAMPRPTIPASSALPPWLIEFQKTHQVDSSTVPAPGEGKKEEPSESLPGWVTEATEAGETVAPLPAAEAKTSTSEDVPSWLPLPPQGTEEAGPSPAQTGLPGQLTEEQAVIPPASGETKSTGPGAPGKPGRSEIQAASIEEGQAELPDWLQTTRAQAVARADAATPATEETPFSQIPDWLQGLQEVVPQEAVARPEEAGTPAEPREQEEQPLATAQAREEPGAETEAEAALALPQEQVAAASGLAAESGLIARSGWAEKETCAPEGELLESGALATEAQAEPAEALPEGESEPIVLEEEAADRELYGDQTAVAAPEAQKAVEELEAAPSAPIVAAPAEASAQEELPPTEFLRRRRDPKGYSQLVQARAHCQANRLGEALKEYDYLVQHSPRLVNAVIEDLEELVQREDVPLEAHRILGDAYTRADRLAEALERYRFVLERVT